MMEIYIKLMWSPKYLNQIRIFRSDATSEVFVGETIEIIEKPKEENLINVKIISERQQRVKNNLPQRETMASRNFNRAIKATCEAKSKCAKSLRHRNCLCVSWWCVEDIGINLRNARSRHLRRWSCLPAATWWSWPQPAYPQYARRCVI